MPGIPFSTMKAVSVFFFAAIHHLGWCLRHDADDIGHQTVGTPKLGSIDVSSCRPSRVRGDRMRAGSLPTPGSVRAKPRWHLATWEIFFFWASAAE